MWMNVLISALIMGDALAPEITPKGNNITTILIVIGVVLVIVGVTIAVVVAKRKKK